MTIEDPRLPDGKTQVEIDVNGHEKGRDDNGKTKTNVNSDGAKPVEPTDEKQDTGVIINNPDKDTKVTAKDKNGNDVPADIDKDGHVHVTPGKDVEGPITVKVTDPDLPGGEVEVKIPVKTTVDQSGKKNVQATDKKQGTGVKVQNPDKDTKVTAKDGKGNKVPAEINPETGEIEVTPGTDVEGPINLVVEDPDLPGGKAEIQIEVDKTQNPGNPQTPGTDDQNDPSDGNVLGVDVYPSYDPTDLMPGAHKDVPVVLKDKKGNKVKLPEGLTAEIGNPEVGQIEGAKWTFETKKDAVVSSQAPSMKELAGTFKKGGSWDDFVKQYTPIAAPELNVTVKQGEHPANTTAKFRLVGEDGKWILDPNGDFDKDGVSNKDEIDKGLNPFDAKDNGVIAGRCAASAVGFGLPLIALLPLGLASQIQIPVLSDVAAQVDAQLKAVNTRIQQQAGIFNPEMARQAEQINAQLRTVGADLGMVAAGIVLIAAGILAGTVIYDNCKPGGPSSSVKDLELKGSSGKTTKLSSQKKDAKASATPKE